jgi:polyisoprenoid-binding protein YceI
MNAGRTIATIAALAAVAWLGTFSTAWSQEQQSPGTGAYEIDPVHSTIVFGITHLGVSYFYGRINAPYGTFTFDPENPSAASFQITASTDKIDTGNPRRDGHLKSADFFNARQFPTITFASTAVRKSAGKTYQVTGNLTMHGVTKQITVSLEHVGSASGARGDLCGFKTAFTLNRSDYGIDYMPEGLGQEVTVMVGLEGKR